MGLVLGFGNPDPIRGRPCLQRKKSPQNPQFTSPPIRPATSTTSPPGRPSPGESPALPSPRQDAPVAERDPAARPTRLAPSPTMRSLPSPTMRSCLPAGLRSGCRSPGGRPSRAAAHGRGPGRGMTPGGRPEVRHRSWPWRPAVSRRPTDEPDRDPSPPDLPGARPRADRDCEALCQRRTAPFRTRRGRVRGRRAVRPGLARARGHDRSGAPGRAQPRGADHHPRRRPDHRRAQPARRPQPRWPRAGRGPRAAPPCRSMPPICGRWWSAPRRSARSSCAPSSCAASG